MKRSTLLLLALVLLASCGQGSSEGNQAAAPAKPGLSNEEVFKNMSAGEVPSTEETPLADPETEPVD